MTTVYSTVADGSGAWRIPLPAGLAAGSHVVRRRMVEGGAAGAWRRQTVTLSADDVSRIDAAWALAAAEGYAAGALRQARVAALLAGGASAALMTYLVTAGLTGAVAGADFRIGRYWLPAAGDASVPTDASEAAFFAQFTAASTTARTYFDSAGALRADLAANQPRFSWVGGARRLVLEAAVTNKVTCRKHNPTDATNVTTSGDAAAVLSVVDDAAALTAAGLSAVCTNGLVYKLDNSAGTTTAVALLGGTTGNTNAHSFAAYARVSAGSATLRLSSGEGSVTFTNSTFALVKAESVTPGASGRTLALTAAAGAVVYFILPGLYEQSFAPHAPIIGDTAAAVTRAIETCRLPAGLEAVLQGTAGTGLVRATPRRAGTSSSDIPVMLGGPVHPLIGLRSATAVRTMLDGVAVLDASPGSGILANGLGATFAWSADGAASCANGGAVVSSATSILPGIRSTGWLGRAGGGGYVYGEGLYDLMAVWPARLPNASIQSLAVPYA